MKRVIVQMGLIAATLSACAVVPYEGQTRVYEPVQTGYSPAPPPVYARPPIYVSPPVYVAPPPIYFGFGHRHHHRPWGPHFEPGRGYRRH